MANQYVFFYLMKAQSERIGQIVPAHVAYWADNHSVHHTGGPFADRTGGMIVFEAEGLHDAERLAHNDPFVIQRVVENCWIKEWMPNR